MNTTVLAAPAAAAATSSIDLRGLRHVGLAHPLDEAAVQRLRTAFPALRFEPVPREGWQSAVAQADALLLGRQAVPVDALLEHALRLRWIHGVGAGVERLVTPRLRASGVVLTNSRGVHAVPIAEHVLALMLAFARQLPALLQSQQAARWIDKPLRGTFELQGQTLAVVGLGEIGGALARKAAALGLRVLAVRRRPQQGGGALPPGVERVAGLDGLDAVLAEADHVAVCLPLTDATRGLFDAARLARLRAGAHLYNIGRGALVDSAALLAALESGRLGGAGLDVTDPEPLPSESPLWRHPRVVITAHTSAASPRNGARMLDILADNLGRAARGEPLRNQVDLAQGY
ncbi:D-2-hydroxyacid dehydrogenase [Xylophilus sp.]|uniref:D-2-hydroxyacid dehydrogenase n=1 Tax=Xylophilus sp. TaxID=2653893 RepID=UPI0013BAD274|nr:D-2-hydroxyacid dehydrogenase [Xylophilus sp.]KAF1049192.1 MAG: Glyoxylate/hydroxypyruvate reductase B [Xylophilus sp.]